VPCYAGDRRKTLGRGADRTLDTKLTGKKKVKKKKKKTAAMRSQEAHSQHNGVIEQQGHTVERKHRDPQQKF